VEGVTLGQVARKARVSRIGNRRPGLPFRSVNVRGQPDYQADMQRHHLLPRQLLGTRGLCGMFAQLGRERIGFDDFRRNGLLLPASVSAALRVGLPLHRGPHRNYNAMVAERVGQIEADWSRRFDSCSRDANGEAMLRLELLQRALRRRLLDDRRGRLTLSRKDPFRSGQDFTELDAMVDQLWAATDLQQG
jgi:hypothetical protein